MNELRRKRLPPLTALKTFESVARLMSFKDAAEELFVTPSAVSHQMRQLEDFIGVKLFIRNARTIELTGDGKTYFNSIIAVFDDINAATSNIISKRKKIILSLNVPASFYDYWLKNHIDQFLFEHQEVELNLVDPNKPSARFDSKEEIKLNFLWGNKTKLETDNTLFLQSHGVVFCSPTILQHEIPFSNYNFLAQYNQLHLSMWPYAWDYLNQSLDLKVMPSSEQVKYFDSTGVLIDAAVAGAGVAISDEILVKDLISQGKLVSLLDLALPSQNFFYLSHEPELADHYIVKAFKAWIAVESHKD